MKEIFDLFENNNSEKDLSIYLSLIFDEKKIYNLLSKEALMTVLSQIFIKFKQILISDSFETKRNLIRIREFLVKLFEVDYLNI